MALFDCRLSLLALAALALGCASSAFKVAQQEDTAAAYRAFLADHPRDPNAEAARLALSEKEFEAASAHHTLLAYKRFLEEFPDAPKAAAARALLEGIRFNAAKEQDTAVAWRRFLRDHPAGAQREEAERALAEAEFREAGPEADVAALARLVRERPDDPRRLELQTRLDAQAFESARQSGAFALYDYLRTFPAGAHREQAQAELFSLKMRGLLFSGLVAEAKQELSRSPLAPLAKELPGQLQQAEARARALAGADETVKAAQVGYYLRAVADLEKALFAPDPLDRWQAAEELGQHVSVAALDPLLDALRTARNPLIRQRAFESLRSILSALPRAVGDYEVASRLEALRGKASSPETWLVVAVLLDLSGRLPQAATEYQRAWDPAAPDPLILRRWVELRRERKQPFSAAVAARQLALWAEGRARAVELPEQGGKVAVTDARELCAAAEQARFALDAIAFAKGAATEFPEDVVRFELAASDAVRLADARLKDAELLLRAQAPDARTCDDRRVADRLAEAVKRRVAALQALLSRPPGEVPRAALAPVREADPSAEVRSLAARVGE